MPSTQYTYPDTEPIWAALFSVLKTNAVLKSKIVTFSRRPVPLPDLTQAQQPALFVVQVAESYGTTTPATRPRPRGLPEALTLQGFIICAVYEPPQQGSPGQETRLNATDLNFLTRAVRNALVPDTNDGKLSLGGLIDSCYIEGDAIFDLGITSQQASVTIPIYMFIP